MSASSSKRSNRWNKDRIENAVKEILVKWSVEDPEGCLAEIRAGFKIERRKLRFKDEGW